MARLGELIKEKRKRKGWSQTVLGDLVGMSTATIHRIEHGEKIPTDDELSLFAETLTLDVSELLSIAEDDRQTLKDRLVPPTSYQTRWEFAHPADYSGRVWIQIHPQSKTDNPLDVHIGWGAWEYQSTLDVQGQKSISLWHYKFNDGQGLPLIVELSQPCYIVFGKDSPPDKPVMDIINEWQRVEPMSFRQLVRFIMNFISVYIRWHIWKPRSVEK